MQLADGWPHSLGKALHQLLEYCGEDLSPQPESAWVQDYLDPIVHVPTLWIDAGSLHVGDAATASMDVIRSVDKLWGLLAKAGHDREDITRTLVDIQVTINDELNYHVNSFLPVAGKIRWSVFLHDCLPRNLAARRPSPVSRRWPSIPVERMSAEFAARGSVPEAEVSLAVRALARVDRGCRNLVLAANEFTREPEAPFDMLLKRFVNLQASMLVLGRVLLDADVAALVLSRCLDSDR